MQHEFELRSENSRLKEENRLLSEALRDIYNDIGEDETVKQIFNEVYYLVKDYA